MGEIRVGTASWTDKTLLASGWYPAEVRTPAERLAYYAARFGVVEVDSTYYNPPNERNSALWAARTPPGFTFNVKAFSLLTQHPTRPFALYKDLRPDTDKKNLYLADLAPQVVDAVWERFLGALRPLHDAGKLGVLLFQFPAWFPIGRRNRAYLLECQERCAGTTPAMRICVEFRSASWMTAQNQSETLDFLASYSIPYVCVDMPQGHSSSIPPVLAATAGLAVIRFHGHSEQWRSRDIYQRFGYRYSDAELAAWAPKIATLAESVRTTYVLMNNCYRDYAQTNAHQLSAYLANLPK